jgi:hypothetical protein
MTIGTIHSELARNCCNSPMRIPLAVKMCEERPEYSIGMDEWPHLHLPHSPALVTRLVSLRGPAESSY